MWTTPSGIVIRLITLAEFDGLPPGTVLRAIDDARLVKGVDHIDLDTRGGYLAVGFEKVH